MAKELEMPESDSSDSEEQDSLVERIFDDPDSVSEGEYWAIYEFLLNPVIRDDAEAIAGALQEFSGWAQYMLKRMRKRGLIVQTDKK